MNSMMPDQDEPRPVTLMHLTPSPHPPCCQILPIPPAITLVQSPSHFKRNHIDDKAIRFPLVRYSPWTQPAGERPPLPRQEPPPERLERCAHEARIAGALGRAQAVALSVIAATAVEVRAES
jgi:hypothetical protein